VPERLTALKARQGVEWKLIDRQELKRRRQPGYARNNFVFLGFPQQRGIGDVRAATAEELSANLEAVTHRFWWT